MAAAGASGASDAPTSLVMSTEQGDIVLTLRYDSAPITAAYIANVASQGLYNGA